MTQTINKNKRRAIEKVLRKRGYESFDNKPISSLTDTMLLLYITGILDLYDTDVVYYEDIYKNEDLSDSNNNNSYETNSYDNSHKSSSNDSDSTSSNDYSGSYNSGYSSSYDSSDSSSSSDSGSSSCD